MGFTYIEKVGAWAAPARVNGQRGGKPTLTAGGASPRPYSVVVLF